MMSRAYTMLAAALLVLGLGGCQGGVSPVGGGAGASVERADSFDVVSERSGPGVDVVADEAKPQAGGFTALPADYGDKVVHLAEGSVEPVCRLSSGKIQYRFQGSVYRKHETADGEYTLSDVCLISHMTVRFWSGHACESREIKIQDCTFNDFVASEQMDVYNLYSHVIHKVSITPEMGPVSQHGDSSDSPSNIPSAIDASKLSNPIFKNLVDFHPACKIENALPVDNQLVNVSATTVSDDLPECTFSRRLPKGTLKGAF